MPEPVTPTTTPTDTGTPAPAPAPVTGTAPATGREETPQEKVERLIAGAEAAHEAGLEALPPDPGPGDKVFKVKGPDGVEESVTLEDLLRGYQRQQDYTKKTQSLAEQRKALDAERRALLDSDAAKALRAMAEQDPGKFDPLDPDSMMAHLRKQIAEQMQALYAPVEEAYQTEAAKAKVTAFIESKPEFRDASFKSEVATLLKQEEGLTLQTAYELVSARRLRAEADALRTEAERHRKLLAEAGLQAGAGTAGRDVGGVPPHIVQQGAVAIAEWAARRKGSW